MKNKQLGIFALIGAPFLFIDMLVGKYYPDFSNAGFSGFACLLYISGWLAAVEGLRRTLNNGTSDFSSIMIRIVMVTLILADLSNVWQLFSQSRPTLFFVLDSCWPVSNVLMLGVAWVVLKSGKISGWKKWMPLLLGCWFPVCILLGRTDFAFVAGGTYSAVAWSLFAISVMTTKEEANPVWSGPNLKA
jgi:hypothetical protein